MIPRFTLRVHIFANRTGCRHLLWSVAAIIIGLASSVNAQEADPEPAVSARDVLFERDVQPILTTYCTGCHGATEPEGELSLVTFGRLTDPSRETAVLAPGEPDKSRLLLVLTGAAEPSMPPDDEPKPSAEEIDVIRRWIAGGAQSIGAGAVMLNTPGIPPVHPGAPSILSLDVSADGSLLAIGRYQSVEIRNQKNADAEPLMLSLPGKANRVTFSTDGKLLAVASGITGVSGTAIVYDIDSRTELFRTEAHADVLFDVVVSPDRTFVATAGYDRTIRLHTLDDGKLVHTFDGHNGAVFDLAFSPDSKVLASSSGDATVKLWSTATGERLDTLSQPQGEQYAVGFSPNGRRVIAAGADNRIRVWRLRSIESPQINPLRIARYSHERAINALGISSDGRWLVTAAEDGTMKLWNAGPVEQRLEFPVQSASVTSVAFDPAANEIVVGRLDGSMERYALPDAGQVADAAAPETDTSDHPITPVGPETADTQPAALTETEPNDSVGQAAPLTLPVTISGTIAETSAARGDADVFAFDAVAGQSIVIEVDAARSQSPLDSFVEILDADGNRMLQTKLQAVRDSYFTFRGKDSSTTDDFRVFNWQEMELDEYLYANGEVVRLWLYPRGPDSGFKVYPGAGSRHTYFGTTAMSHALQAPCYIVQPFAPDAEIVDNGLPVFPVYFENDDDSLRELGTDSRLFFTARHDGRYVLRITDARGFGGDDFTYKCTVRNTLPDFRVTLGGQKATVPKSGGREFSVTAQRTDGFRGPVEVRVENVPPGYFVTSPVVIERDQRDATGIIWATAAADPVDEEAWKDVKVTASALIRGQAVTHDVGSIGPIELAEPAKVSLTISVEPAQPQAPRVSAFNEAGELIPAEIVIRPGETVRAVVNVERREFDDQISFGNEDSGRNLPHGLFVDNIGLNGLLIVTGATEREFFVTASRMAQPTSRLFHLRANVEGGLVSLPVIVTVLPAETATQASEAAE